MEFPARQCTAIVGPSGCGKSTVAALIAGLRQEYTGHLLLDEQEQAGLSANSLANHIVYIGHRPVLFQGTVEENLRLGKPLATEEQLCESLNQVCLEGEVTLQLRLSEGGANLSGGQRQRLAIARALLSSASVYIFDEATANIDAESEDDIIALAYDLARTKTVILISHRLKNVEHADRIYVLDTGCLAEAGDHNTLLAQGGIYAKLWEQQRQLEAIREAT
jgi:ABC-type transport system involved in cytochrome bd biosynthesis fused ATPase/permease subunit